MPSKEGRLVLSRLPVGPGLVPAAVGLPLGLTLALCLTQLQCQTVPAGHLCVLQLHWSLWLWTMRGLNVTFQARARPKGIQPACSPGALLRPEALL